MFPCCLRPRAMAGIALGSVGESRRERTDCYAALSCRSWISRAAIGVRRNDRLENIGQTFPSTRLILSSERLAMLNFKLRGWFARGLLQWSRTKLVNSYTSCWGLGKFKHGQTDWSWVIEADASEADNPRWKTLRCKYHAIRNGYTTVSPEFFRNWTTIWIYIGFWMACTLERVRA